jgi:CubicO group peptidase (beta-lactamase class C family)
VDVELDQVLTAAIESGELRGLAASVATPRGIWEGAAGLAAAERPMTVDTVMWIASMTKPVSAVAVMQLVESGVLDLDAPAGDLVPYLAEVQVLEALAQDGTPALRPPKRPVTLRHLLTHTAGFGYEFTDATLARLAAGAPGPAPAMGSRASYETPLLFDPGERWLYGIGIDWAGQVLEAATGQRLDSYLQRAIFDPLGMADTGFRVSPEGRARRAAMHARTEDGLTPIPFELPEDQEMAWAGGGLYSTVVDYLKFVRMLLGRGTLGGERLLKSETVATMAVNHIGELEAGGWRTVDPAVSNDVEFYPGMPNHWGLSFLINTGLTPEGRSPGSLAWAGLANTYFWIDLARSVGGVFATQVLPFFDQPSVDVFRNLERTTYSSL